MFHCIDKHLDQSSDDLSVYESLVTCDLQTQLFQTCLMSVDISFQNNSFYTWKMYGQTFDQICQSLHYSHVQSFPDMDRRSPILVQSTKAEDE